MGSVVARRQGLLAEPPDAVAEDPLAEDALDAPVEDAPVESAPRPRCDDGRAAVVVTFGEHRIRPFNGVELTPILVGSLARCESWGQDPALRGNAWEFDVDLQCGAYDVVFRGGGNGFHGILSVHIGREFVGTVDQYEARNTFPLERSLYWQCLEEGRYTVFCTVSDKAADSLGYWICLNSIIFDPVPIRRVPVLTTYVQLVAGQAHVKCVNMAGNTTACFALDAAATLHDLCASAKECVGDAWAVHLITPRGNVLAADEDTTVEQFLQDHPDCQGPQ